MAKQSSVLHLENENENGQTMAEYTIVLAVITVAILIAVALLATNVSSAISRIASLLLP